VNIKGFLVKGKVSFCGYYIADSTDNAVFM
jgi:hypothetical protein